MLINFYQTFFLSFIGTTKNLLSKFTLEVYYFNMYIILILLLDILKYNIIDLSENKREVY